MDTIFVIMRPDGTPFHRDDAMGILATDSEAQAIRFQHAREDEGAEYVRYTRAQPPSAASVSERARHILADAYRDAGFTGAVDDALSDTPSPHCSVTLRALEQALTQQRGEPSVRIEDLGQNAPLGHEERGDAEQAYTLTAFDYESAQIGSRDWELYWRGWWHRSQLYTTPQPSADAVREYATELRAQADQKMGVAGACAHDGDRAHYKSAAQLLRRVADELESLLSGGSHA